MDNLKEDSDGNKFATLDNNGNVDEYEEQYNANHDFAIF